MRLPKPNKRVENIIVKRRIQKIKFPRELSKLPWKKATPIAEADIVVEKMNNSPPVRVSYYLLSIFIILIKRKLVTIGSKAKTILINIHRIFALIILIIETMLNQR